MDLPDFELAVADLAVVDLVGVGLAVVGLSAMGFLPATLVFDVAMEALLCLGLAVTVLLDADLLSGEAVLRAVSVVVEQAPVCLRVVSALVRVLIMRFGHAAACGAECDAEAFTLVPSFSALALASILPLIPLPVARFDSGAGASSTVATARRALFLDGVNVDGRREACLTAVCLAADRRSGGAGRCSVAATADVVRVLPGRLRRRPVVAIA
jgi:hypothetical protein